MARGMPWVKFDYEDFCGDYELQQCSLETQGFYVHLLKAINHGETPGFLPANPEETLNFLLPFSKQTIRKHLRNLQENNVLKQGGNGIWYSKRMYEDWLKYRKSQAYGKLGGNPKLKEEGLTPPLNPPLKAPLKVELEVDKEIEEEGELPPEVKSLTAFLRTLILENKPDRKISVSWDKSTSLEIDRMIRLDDRPPETIRQVIEWCQQDDFWWKNILSGKKLREQFDRLESDMRGDEGGEDDPEVIREKIRRSQEDARGRNFRDNQDSADPPY